MLYLMVILPFIVNFLPIKNKKLKTLLAAAPAIFVIVFRWGLGNDYFSYEFLYTHHDVSSFSNALRSQTYALEPAFRILIYFFKNLGLSFQFFIASIGLLIYGFFVKWLDDTDLNISLSLMLFNGMFFIVWILSGIRQGLVMAIGTYFFFNKKKKLNLWQSLLLIVILWQFHISAIIYLPLIIVKNIKFNQKSLIAILTFSLIMTFIPYHFILEPFKDTIIIKKLFQYTMVNNGLMNLADLIRLAFASFILIFYPYFKKDKYMTTLANMNIFGFSLYFLFKLFQTASARLNVFTFILIIPLIIYLVYKLEIDHRLQKLLLGFLLVFSLFYLQKDLLYFQVGAGKKTIEPLYKLKTYYNIDYQDYYDFDNQYAFFTYHKNHCLLNKKIKSPLSKVNTNKGHIVVKGENGQYGVLDDLGQWTIKPQFDKKPKLYGDILFFEENEINNQYFDLNKQPLFADKIILAQEKIAALKITEKEIVAEKAWQTLKEYHDYESHFKNYFPYPQRINDIWIYSYKVPFPYDILRVAYEEKHYYFILDKDFKIKDQIFFIEEIRFDINNMATSSTFCGDVIINSNGDIVWIKDEGGQ